MRKIKIDGKEIEVPNDSTVLQAAEQAGVEIPRFCFHERLSIAGNCRMCLVEVKGGPPKPQASCALSIKDLRDGPNGESPEIFTQSDMVKKARESVLEFMLINHPIDCPVCDQAGECDLQDQAMLYGRVDSRYREPKRSIEDKYLGPLISTNMTRCIHCTRCVRFTTEVAGISQLGLIGRGEDAEITSYLERALDSELQGNVIDLCPVGALTSRPYQFRARPWELSHAETIDVMDATGSAIRVDSRGNEILRILPKLNEEINEEWISDKTRFVADGLRANRIDSPYLKIEGKFQSISWQQAFDVLKNKVKSVQSTANIGALAGPLATVEEMYAFKYVLSSLGSRNFDCRGNLTALNSSYGRSSYLLNPTICGVEHADAILFIGANPRKEAPLINSRIMRNYRKNRIPIGCIGEKADLTYDYTFLGHGTDSLVSLYDGSVSFIEKLKQANNPMVIVGSAALSFDASFFKSIMKLSQEIGAITPQWNGFGVLHDRASLVGGLDIGFVPSEGQTYKDVINQSEILFLLGADDINFSENKAFTVYIGTHGDYGANYADLILPAATYIEKSGIYVNLEGRPQLANQILLPPGQAKDDILIIRSIAEALSLVLPFDNLNEIRSHIFASYPQIANIGNVTAGNIDELLQQAIFTNSFEKRSLGVSVKDFYLTNAIARSSKTLASCSAFYQSRRNDSESFV